MRIPLPALISGAVAIGSFMVWMGWQAAQQANNMQQLAQAIVKVEKRLDDRDGRLDSLRDTMFQIKSDVDMSKMRIGELERTRK